MKAIRLYRGTQTTLLVLLAAGLSVFILVRAPEGTSSDRILRDVALTGRIDGFVAETAAAIRSLAAALTDASVDEVDARRDTLEILQIAVERLLQDVRDHSSSWIPVADACDLLQQTWDCSQDSLMRVAKVAPSVPDPEINDEGLPGAPDSAPILTGTNEDPALAHTRAEVAMILNARAQQLVEQSQRLRTRIEQAITEGMLAQGTFGGLETASWLLGVLVVAAVVGTTVLEHAVRRMQLSPERLERMELELMGRTDRPGAVRRCHQRVRSLLDLADSLCRGGKT